MRQSELHQVIERLQSVVQADPRYAPQLQELYVLFRQNEAILYGPEFMGEIDFQALAENLRGIVFPQRIEPNPLPQEAVGMKPEPPLQFPNGVQSTYIWADIKTDVDLARIVLREAHAFKSTVFDRLREILDEYGESVATLAGNYPRMIRDALRKEKVADKWWRWEKEVRIVRKE